MYAASLHTQILYLYFPLLFLSLLSTLFQLLRPIALSFLSSIISYLSPSQSLTVSLTSSLLTLFPSLLYYPSLFFCFLSILLFLPNPPLLSSPLLSSLSFSSLIFCLPSFIVSNSYQLLFFLSSPTLLFLSIPHPQAQLQSFYITQAHLLSHPIFISFHDLPLIVKGTSAN